MSVLVAYLGVLMIWSTTPLAIQWSSVGGGFLFAASARMALAAMLAGALIKGLRIAFPWHRQACQAYASSAIGLFGGLLLTYWSAQYIPSGMVSVMFGFSPFWASGFSAMLLQEERITRSKALAMIIGTLGLAVVFSDDVTISAENYPGLVGAFLAAGLFSLSTVMVRRLGATLHPFAMTAGGLIFAAPAYVFVWFVGGGYLPDMMPLRAIGALAYLAVFGSLVGFLCYFYIVKKLSAAKVAMTTMITPVIALLLGATLNHERIDATTWFGVVLIVFALAAHQGFLLSKKSSM